MLAWDESAARATIEAIASDTHANFDAQNFWPPHPSDEWVRQGDTSLYWGATGNIWALDYLAGEDAAAPGRNFAEFLAGVLARNAEAFARLAPLAGVDPKQSSFLLGDAGPLLLTMRLAPTAETADALHARISANLAFPAAELMWGVPGTMLACVFLHAMTREPRWIQLYEFQATKLLAELEETESGPIWTQLLYDRKFRFLGLVHGFAGNVLALLRGWAWLDETQQAKVRDALARTLPANIVRTDKGLNWRADALGPMEARLVQICHGAPGMIVACADSRVLGPQLQDLLCEAGECVWQTGALAKGGNLCHGTAGNGYALLKLFDLTQDELWLARARSFATSAIAQWHEAQQIHNRGRYSLWTGDPGLAIFL
ncbi:MAG TPA: LanC-like protein [Rhizomicrobium sp.]|jgi:hypothetical protein|nr:LanC-like protein [Rhizomicrobium sp.]